MKKYLVLFFILLALLFFFLILKKKSGEITDNMPQKPIVRISGVEIISEVVLSQKEQEKGLSGRTSLGANEGMLFLFPTPRKPFFWMKEMLFPIDIIWIRENRIVDITENIPFPKDKNQSLPTYMPEEMVDSVLEVNAYFCKKNNLKKGDLVEVVKR